MGIKHATVDKEKGDIILASDWNAEHDDVLIADIDSGEFNTANKLLKLDVDAKVPLVQATMREAATIIVAASDSLHPERADYVCNGVADDVEIQAAIDALPAVGGTVLLLEGNYNISNTIASVSNLSFQGYGAIITLANNADLDMLSFPSDGKDITIEGFIFDGNGANQSVHSSDIIRTLVGEGVAMHITVHNNRFQNANYDTVSFDDHVDSLIDNNYFYNCGHVHIRDHSSSRDVISNNTFDTWLYSGINVEGRGTTVVNNGFINWSDSEIPAIRVTTSDAISNIIIGNVFYGSGIGRGIIVMAEAAGLKGLIISNNIFYSLTYAINQAGSNTLIKGNSFIECGNAIHIGGLDRVSIISNLFTDCNEGVRHYQSIGGIISNNMFDTIGTYAIRLEAGAYTNITNNTFVNISSNVDNADPVIRAESEGANHSLHNMISNNICYSTIANKPSYFYSRDGNADYAIIKDNYINDVHGFYDTLGIHDVIADPRLDLFMDVLTVSTTHVRSNEDLSKAIPNTFTLDAQPDVPRTLSGHFDSHAQITAYTIDIVGVDAKGNTVTEQKTEADGWDWETSNAFAVITSVIMSARTGTGASDTMDIGITDVLGLSNIIYETGDVYKITKTTGGVSANAVVAGAQVDVDNDTYDMSVITLGAGDTFTIWFKSNLNIIS